MEPTLTIRDQDAAEDHPKSGPANRSAKEKAAAQDNNTRDSGSTRKALLVPPETRSPDTNVEGPTRDTSETVKDQDDNPSTGDLRDDSLY